MGVGVLDRQQVFHQNTTWSIMSLTFCFVLNFWSIAWSDLFPSHQCPSEFSFFGLFFSHYHWRSGSVLSHSWIFSHAGPTFLVSLFMYFHVFPDTSIIWEWIIFMYVKMAHLQLCFASLIFLNPWPFYIYDSIWLALTKMNACFSNTHGMLRVVCSTHFSVCH